MKRLLLQTITCLLLLAATVTAQQDALDVRAPKEGDGALAWKFKEGQVIDIAMDQEVTMSSQIGGNSSEIVNGSRNEMTLEVQSVDSEGVATVTNIIKRMIIKTEAPGMSVEIDTSSDEELDAIASQIAAVVKPLIGAEITQKMAPNGKITDVVVPSDIFDGMQGNPAAAMFNEETIKETTSKANLVFPETAPAVGDSWTNEATMNMGPAKVATDTTYQYLGVADVDGKPLHVIRGKIKMSFPDGIQGMDVDIAEEDTTFMFYFDGNAGRIAKSVLDQNVSMVIEAGGQLITQDIAQAMTMTYSSDD
jgi:hypothetical protein